MVDGVGRESERIPAPQRPSPFAVRGGSARKTRRSFDTSKVRLEGVLLQPLDDPRHDFNTSKVRLEVKRTGGTTVTHEYFNTSKVRLEGAPQRDLHAVRQYISIPQRCDWKVLETLLMTPEKCISIPQRCDWKGSPESGRSPC